MTRLRKHSSFSSRSVVVTGGGLSTAASRPALNWPRIRRRLIPYALVAPALLILAAVLLYPLGTLLVESLNRVEPTISPDWHFIGLDNYARMLADPDVVASLGRTLIWTVGSVVAQLAIGLAAALILGGPPFRGRALLRAALLLPWATPAVVGALSWKWVYHGQYGLLNAILDGLNLANLATAWLGDPHTAMPAVIVANVWRGFPFIMVVLLASVVAIPRELYEAARVDGASAVDSTRYITLPLIRPGILLSTLLAAIWTFNNFSYIYILTGGGPAGLTDILVTFVYSNGFRYWHFGYAAALSVALFALVVAASLVYIRLLSPRRA
jgi:multiple sugar transport system permease protein